MHLNAIYYSNILVFALVCTLNFSKATIATLKNLGLARFLRGEKGESKLNIKDQIFTKILYHWTLKPEKVYVLGKSLTIFLLGMRNWKLRLEVKMYFKYVKYLNTVGKDHTHHHDHPKSRSNREQEVPKGTHPSLTGVAPGADEKEGLAPEALRDLPRAALTSKSGHFSYDHTDTWPPMGTCITQISDFSKNPKHYEGPHTYGFKN